MPWAVAGHSVVLRSCHRQAARRRRRPQPCRVRHGPDRRVHRRGLPDPARQPGTPHRPRAASTWDALLTHIRDPADATRLARSATDRLLYRYAIPLYRHAVDAGAMDAAWRLTELLAECGDLAGLRVQADAGDEHAAELLYPLLAERGDLAGLRARADAGDWSAAERLADLLADRGDPDEAVQALRARADAGDEYAAWRLAGLLADRGDLDGPSRSCAPGPTPTTGPPPSGWPTC
jgi:hypothetical protein